MEYWFPLRGLCSTKSPEKVQLYIHSNTSDPENTLLNLNLTFNPRKPDLYSWSRLISLIPDLYSVYQTYIQHTRLISLIPDLYPWYQTYILDTRLISNIPDLYPWYQTHILDTRFISLIPDLYSWYQTYTYSWYQTYTYC